MDAVEDIKARLSIEDVIGDYLELKRSGRNFKALSPFTDERTPSFMISPEKQIWHDFSSGKGGNMFSFVMDMEGLDFKGALELLARKAGINLDDYRTGKPGLGTQQKERYYEALEAAASYYQRQLTQQESALRYVRQKRGFSKETLLAFRIGYAPAHGSALFDFLRKKGFTAQELQKTGLVVDRYNKTSDMFRERIMVPLMDPQGRVIGFTARLLRDQPNAPKYINTPQTFLYDKGRHVFAFHLAKEAIRQKKYCILVEGNLDVISAHQAGTAQTVATAGTALTEHQIKSVLHFTDDIRICFDQDSAGQAAIERSIGVASKLGVSLSVLPLPAGKDPDDVIQADQSAWEKLIEQPVYAIDWLLERYHRQLDTKTAQGKRAFTDVVLARLAELQDPVERDHYVRLIAEQLAVSEQALKQKLGSMLSPKQSPKKRSTKPAAPLSETAKQEQSKYQNQLLALALFQPALRKTIISIPSEVIIGDDAQKLLQALAQSSKSAEAMQAEGLLSISEEYVKILQLQFEELYGGLELIDLRDEAKRLRWRLIEQYVTLKKRVILKQLETADEATEATLLAEVNQLNALLKH